MKSRKNRIPLFYLVTCLYWISLYTYVPVFPTYVRSIGSSYQMVGLSLGAYGFGQMLLRIPLGIASDRLGRRKLFVALGFVFSMAAALGLWLFTTPWAVFVSRLISGFSAAAWVSFTVLFSSYYAPSEAPRAIGIINALCAFGSTAGIFIGGVASQRFGTRASFLLALLAAAAAFVLCPFIRENVPAAKEPLRLRSLLAVAASPGFLLICLLAVFAQFITFATVYGFTPVAAKALGANSFDLGLLTSLSVLPGIFSSVVSGTVLARRFGEKPVIIGGFLITTLSCVAIPLIHSLSVLYLSQIIGGIGLGGAFPMLMGLSIKNVAGEKRSSAMGFFQAIYGIGMFSGPLAVGFLTEFAGLNWGLWSIGLIGAAAIGITVVSPITAAGKNQGARSISSANP